MKTVHIDSTQSECQGQPIQYVSYTPAENQFGLRVINFDLLCELLDKQRQNPCGTLMGYFCICGALNQGDGCNMTFSIADTLLYIYIHK